MKRCNQSTTHSSKLPLLATRPSWLGLGLSTIFGLACASSSLAATFTVNTATDPASPIDAGCTVTECTLREAITAANVDVAADTIEFNIPGSGERLIALSSVLPNITQSLTINGYSQPGTSVNTDPTISNAVLLIRLDGAALTVNTNSAFGICGGSFNLSGLSITNFRQAGVAFGGQAGSGATCSSGLPAASIKGNFFGVTTDGTTSGELRNSAVNAARSNTLIGGPNVADRNVIAGGPLSFQAIGISSTASNGSQVLNNLIGTDRTGTAIRGFLNSAVDLGTVSNVDVGSATAPNLIAHSNRGVVIAAGALNVRAAFNRYFRTQQLNLDLFPLGVTNNDPDDSDTGANNIQNFPVITSASVAGSDITINGSLDVGHPASLAYTLVFYLTDQCVSNGHGDAERIVGSQSVNFSAATESYSVTINTSEILTGRKFLMATATHPTDGTSEISACFNLNPTAPLVVNTTSDTNDGFCDATHCSLREAITIANIDSVLDTIQFAISGTGPHRINLSSVLPAVTRPLVIDGYSQAGAGVNTHAHASNAVLKIMLDGSAFTSASTPLITITDPLAAGSAVRGLSLIRATGAAPFVSIAGDVKIQGNWFGVEADGITAGTMNGDALRVTGVGGLVGGVLVEHRNVFGGAISGPNGSAAIKVTGSISNATIQNNIIGLKPDGLSSNVNLNGLVALAATQINVVVQGNTISCNTLNSILGAGTLYENNRIGTTTDGVANPSCDSDRSIFLSNTVVKDNLFAFISARAAEVSASPVATGVVFSRNRFIGNTTYDIDLGANGHTPNDVLDPDVGANNLQNFPLITLARRITDTQLEISGTLNSLADTKFKLEFFGAASITRTALSGSVPLSEATWIGTEEVTFTTDVNGNASFGPIVVNFPTAVKVNAVSATATRLDLADLSVETSELGLATATFVAGNADLVVTNINTLGEGSFYAAMMEAKARPDPVGGRDRITFNIPGTGPFNILSPVAEYVVNDALEIDGYTQTGSSVNTIVTGTNANVMIQLQSVAMNFSGSPNGLIRGIALFGSTPGVPYVRLNATSALEGSFIGLFNNGVSTSLGFGIAAVDCGVSGCLRVGGSDLAQRNLINSFANSDIPAINGGSGGPSEIRNNVIGIRKAGTPAFNVPPVNPSFATASRGIHARFVGTATSHDIITNNHVGGLAIGIRLSGAFAEVSNNTLGVTITGTTALANSGAGIWIETGGDNTIQSNRIRSNGGDGVDVAPAAVRNFVHSNELASNTGLGLDLGNDGPSNNDEDDIDPGANNMQNHPVLLSARRSLSGVVVDGTFNSTPSKNFDIRYCLVISADATQRGECDIPVTNVVTSITTDSNGDASFTSAPINFVSGATRVTAYATLVDGTTQETSELSSNVTILRVSDLAITSIAPDPATALTSFSVSVAVTSAVVGATATGTVVVSLAGGDSCNAVLNASGIGTCTITPSVGGTFTVTASYDGDGSLTADTAQTSLTVQKRATTTTITSDNADPSSPGSVITVTFTVGSDVGTPTGNVTVTASGGGTCNAVLAGGSGFCQFAPTASGPLTLTAAYSGDATFEISNDTEDHSVGVASSSLQINGITPNPSVFGQSITVSASLTSAFGTPAGPIAISDGAGATCQILSGNGSCNLVPTNVGADQTIRADFAGDAAHTTSTASATHTVNKANTTISTGLPFLTGYPTDIPVQFAPMTAPSSVVAQSPGAGIASGTIVIEAVGGAEICVISLPAQSSCNLTPTSAGVRDFTATYSGDNHFNGSVTTFDTPVQASALFKNDFECIDISCTTR